jgi:hypothetical protein
MAAETLTADPAPVSRERMAQWLSAMKMPRITAIARSEKANARLMISPLGSISFECRLVREPLSPTSAPTCVYQVFDVFTYPASRHSSFNGPR